VLGISTSRLSTIFLLDFGSPWNSWNIAESGVKHQTSSNLLDFGAVPTVWYFVFHLIKMKGDYNQVFLSW
jgi:hypothetical protein